MKKQSLAPVILGVFSALISFIAVVALIARNYKWNLTVTLLLGTVVAVIFYILSYFRLKASLEIKRITKELNLTAKDLAKITGLQETDFPIYNSKLQLIVPKRRWPHILNALQEYERTHKQENKL